MFGVAENIKILFVNGLKIQRLIFMCREFRAGKVDIR